TIDSEKLLEMMGSMTDLVVIDARKDADYQTGWIEGAKHIQNTDVTPETLAAAIPTKETPVAFYCNGPKCGRSSDAALKAIAAGYTKVYYFFGGMAEWSEAGLPTVK
ncbi:MAG: rhodanese-like domain-containing protein, partial [Alphaproteobacteria bacterium]